MLYSEYDAMDTDAIVASALDIIADESTLKNDMCEVLQIKSPDEDIQKMGAQLHCIKLVETENNYVEYYGPNA